MTALLEKTRKINRLLQKSEKVDYAIIQDGKPLILIEVKNHTENLDNHDKQLERYFTVTESRFGILTNGIEYRFYSEKEEIRLQKNMDIRRKYVGIARRVRSTQNRPAAASGLPPRSASAG